MSLSTIWTPFAAVGHRQLLRDRRILAPMFILSFILPELLIAAADSRSTSWVTQTRSCRWRRFRGAAGRALSRRRAR